MQRGGGSRSATMSSSSTAYYGSATTASRPTSCPTRWLAEFGAGALLQAEEAAEGGGLNDCVNDRGGGAWGTPCGCGPCGRGSSVSRFVNTSIDVGSCGRRQHRRGGGTDARARRVGDGRSGPVARQICQACCSSLRQLVTAVLCCRHLSVDPEHESTVCMFACSLRGTVCS